MIIELLIVQLFMSGNSTDYFTVPTQTTSNKAVVYKEYILCNKIVNIQDGYDTLIYKGKTYKTCNITVRGPSLHYDRDYLGSCSSIIKKINKVCK